MVGGDHQAITRPDGSQQARHRVIELLERGGVAGHIPSVAVQRVEVHQIGEDQLGAVGAHRGDGLVDPIGVAHRLSVIAQPVAGKDVVNLAHSIGAQARRH